MRIATISTAQVPSERANSIQVMKVCQALAQLGHEVTLIVPECSQPKNSSQQLMDHYGLQRLFPIEWLAAPTRRLFPWKAVRRACSLKADLLYTRIVPAATLGLLHRLPAVLEMHELPAGRFGPLWYRAFLALPGKKRLLPLTRALRRRLEDVYRPRLSEEQVEVLPSGVDLERFEDLPEAEAARRALGLPSRRTVACTGHLYEGRGTELFLQLAAREAEVNFLWVGGNPSEVKSWRERASALRLGNVTFTGFIPNRNLPDYQAAADVLILPYQASVAGSSGGDISGVFSPLKMFEYMASGRPILCSDLPPLREILSEEMVLFCPPADPDAWQVSLRRLLSDWELADRLGRVVRLEVRKYSWLERAQRALAPLMR